MLDMPKSVPLPAEACSHDGYIIKQSALAGIPNGCRYSDYNGCGWIAVYNALRSMKQEITHGSVRKALRRGLILGGRLGTNPFFIWHYFKRLGFRAALAVRKRTMLCRMKDARAVILFYFHRHGAHYITLLPCPNGCFRVLNGDGCGDCTPTPEQVLGSFRTGLALIIF